MKKAFLLTLLVMSVMGLPLPPSAVPSLIVMPWLGSGEIILVEAGLSFLGLGILPQAVSWGNMLHNSQYYIWSAPHLAVYPGLMILFTVLAVVWQQVNPPVRVDGESVPVLAAGLWSGWMWVLLALLGGQLLVVWLVHRARRWTVALAAAGLVVDLAFAAVIVGLVLADRFFDGVFVEAVTRAGWESAARDLAYATVLSVVVIIVWDQIDTWRRVRAG